MFNTMSGVQQRVLYALAHLGDTATSAEVQMASGLSAANTASALFRLEKQGVVKKIGEKKRNMNYFISDFLFGKWLAAT